MKFNLTLSGRIYISMFTLMVVSFIITGAAAYLNFKRQNEIYHTERLSRKEAIILTSINYYFYQERENDDFFPFYTKAFIDKIHEFSDIHALTINLFDLNGVLITSSDFIEYENSSMEKMVPASVLSELANGKPSVTIRQERGREDHIAVYCYLRNLEGAPIAIINIPYLFSLEPSKEETFNFFKQLSILYLIILIPALFLAFYLSKYITKSLRKVSAKLKSIQINQKNEPIKWESKDEIGALVKEYNAKVKELEESAIKLAQTERESAWREMAKQVAHEIKNPLTPIKLSVQQLQRTWVNKDPDFDEKLNRFTKTLTEQINTLTQIANEFSNFARMPKTEITCIELNQLIVDVIELFEKNANQILISFQPQKEVFVMADKNELVRVFNNLLKNALQAIGKQTNGKIDLTLKSDKNNVLIEITDNGSGIPEALQQNLFVPNFTTKSTGMGLGLAMVKTIIDGVNGKIWFNSKEQIGTTFYIELPLAPRNKISI